MRDIWLILLAAIIASLPFMVLGNHLHRSALFAADSPQQSRATGASPPISAGVTPVAMQR